MAIQVAPCTVQNYGKYGVYSLNIWSSTSVIESLHYFLLGLSLQTFSDLSNELIIQPIHLLTIVYQY